VCPFRQLEDEEPRRVRMFESIDCSDVRMVQGGEEMRFPLKSRDPVSIINERGGEQLQGDVAAESSIAREIHLPHPARAELRDDLIRPENCAGREH
jgi:hypothetical protein